MEKYSKTFVTIGGILFLAFGLFHLTFFKVFNHSNPDYAAIKPFLSKVLFMLNVGMVVYFISMGIVFLRFRSSIMSTSMGRALLLMSASFFIIRGSVEFIFPNFKPAFVATMLVVSLVYLMPVVFIKANRQ
jgi:hypothetical protein